MPGTRKLGKTTAQRMAMLRQQVTDFLDHGKMETTLTRACSRKWLPAMPSATAAIPASCAPAFAAVMLPRPPSSSW